MGPVRTDVAALALGVGRKMLDNILAREARGLREIGRRGRARMIEFEALERIAIALLLARDLSIPVARGLELAVLIGRSPVGDLRVGPLTRLRFDLPRLRTALQDAIIDALDGFVPPRRGRPRRTH